MAYLGERVNEAVALAGRGPECGIRLGDAERQVILQARRDLQLRRAGTGLADRRLEGLRIYATNGRHSPNGARALLAAGFSPMERRVIDAMLDALPSRAPACRPVTGRLIWAALILRPLLFAAGTYGWASLYLEDRLIALVLGGLALLVIAPVANALTGPSRRPY